jgi:signal recognition particle GTPase
MKIIIGLVGSGKTDTDNSLVEYVKRLEGSKL